MSEQVTLLAQADLLFLLTKLFAPPTVDTKTLITSLTFDELIQQTQLPESDKINQLYQQVLQQMESTDLADWQAEYNYLFEGNVACAINETGYDRRDKGAILADIAGFYLAFNMQLSENATEKCDHLICELEFIALLLVRLAKAETEEARTVTYDALAAFCFDHTSGWLTLFCKKISEIGKLYTHLAELLKISWQGIVEANHLPIAELNPQKIIPIKEESDTPYECDMAKELPISEVV